MVRGLCGLLFRLGLSVAEANAFSPDEIDQPSQEDENIGAQQDVPSLQNQLSSAFLPSHNPPENSNANNVLAEPLSLFASASMRQAKAFQRLTDQVGIAVQLADTEKFQKEIGDLCKTFIDADAQAKRTFDEWKNRFKSITDMIATVGGYFAAQRGEAQRHSQAIQEMRDEINRLNDSTEAIRSESAQLRDLVQSDHDEMQSNVRDLKESIVLLRNEQESLTKRIAESHTTLLGEIGQSVESLAKELIELRRVKQSVDDFSHLNTQNVERIEILANRFVVTDKSMVSLQVTSEQIMTRLHAFELAVDGLKRRENILSAFHQQTARALESGDTEPPK